MRIVKVEKVDLTIRTKRQIIGGPGIIPGVNVSLIKVHTNDGITGIGEGTAYNPIFHAAFDQYIKPNVIGKDPHDIELMLSELLSPKTGGLNNTLMVYHAFCGLEYALWDIMGQAAKQPICKLIGGMVRSEINFVAEIFYQPGLDVQDYVQEALTFVKKGFKILKLKGGLGPKMDVAVVREVRKAVGDEIEIILDPNGAWSQATALRIIDKIAKYDIAWVENPLPFYDLEGTARLRKILNSNVPIALCEGTNRIGGIWEIIDIVRREAADIISIDTRRQGGIYMAKKAAAIAEAAGIPVTVHSGSGTGLHIAYFLHLLSTIPNLYFGGTADSLLPYYEGDIVTEPWNFANGSLAVPLEPGVGVKLDESKIEKYADQFRKGGDKTFYAPIPGIAKPGLPPMSLKQY